MVKQYVSSTEYHFVEKLPVLKAEHIGYRGVDEHVDQEAEFEIRPVCINWNEETG